MSDVRRQRRPSPASRVGLQSCQFPAYTGDAGADQRLVADEPEGKAHQDRREAREPRPLCRVSDGRSRHLTAIVRRHPAAHRGTAAAARCGARVKEGKHAYVTNYSFFGPGTVSVIDTATNTVAATVGVGSFPVGVGIIPDIPFSAFSAKLETEVHGAPNEDSFELQSSFTLGSTSNGSIPSSSR
jgi:YVTN family beta-propeller protein